MTYFIADYFATVVFSVSDEFSDSFSAQNIQTQRNSYKLTMRIDDIMSAVLVIYTLIAR